MSGVVADPISAPALPQIGATASSSSPSTAQASAVSKTEPCIQKSAAKKAAEVGKSGLFLLSDPGNGVAIAE